MAVLCGSGAGFCAPPDHDLHAESTAIAGHELADAAITPYAERFAAQHGAQAEVGRH